MSSKLRSLSERRKRNFICNCLVICVLLMGLNIFLSVRFGGDTIAVAGMDLQINSLNGCIQTISFIVCILMIFASTRAGLICSLAVIGVSLVGPVRTIIALKTLNPLPSAFISLLFIVAVIIVAKQFRYSEEKAITDEVTGLCNSYEFENRLFLSVLHNERGYLLLIHLDGVLQANVNLGREIGDYILKVVAGRIKAQIDEKSQVFKVEGAEYAVILSENENPNEIANKIVECIEEPVSLKKGDVVTSCLLTAYVGIASYMNGDVSAPNLIKRADIAMNFAIKSEEFKVCEFSDAIKDKIERAGKVENLIKESLINDNFYLVYQPQYTTSDKRLRGFETLIRMKPQNGECISPGEFISVAERSELILDIDRFVLRRAMTEFKDVCIASGNTIAIAINVSAKEVASPGFADRLLRLIDEIGFPTECLEIEITEYSFAGMQSHTIENILRLREKQVMIALDDFGTGYTSLEQLMKLPVNLVKVDKSLIDDVAKSKLNTDFIKSVIYMGHLMDAEVIAEGVEAEDQLEQLRSLDCDFIQGFLWGKPIDYKSACDLAASFC